MSTRTFYPLPSKKVNLIDQMLILQHVISFEDFMILGTGASKFQLKVKGTLPIKRDKFILNQNTTSRSSHQRCSIKKGALRILRKTPVPESLF